MIGKMERVDLRKVWKDEARDFTSWLFDNIRMKQEILPRGFLIILIY
jgi:hypothetical protein